MSLNIRKNIELMVFTLWDTHHIIRSFGFKKNYNLPDETGKSLVILGNGKSLNNIKIDQNGECDFMVVNGHVLHPSYSEIKPKFYCLIDALYFAKEKGENFETLRKINEETTWDMYLFIPYYNFKETRSCINNPCIKIITFSPMKFRGFKNLKYWIYKKGLAMPEVHNIITVCIMQALQMHYSLIELYGVEHNWTKFLFVGDDNYVYLEDAHFYDSQKINATPYMYMGEHITMYQALNWYSLMFKSYLEIVEYVKACNIPVRIINKAKGSFIDAFERG